MVTHPVIRQNLYTLDQHDYRMVEDIEGAILWGGMRATDKGNLRRSGF